MDFNFEASQTNTSFSLNGTLVEVADLNSIEDVATEINDQSKGEFGVVATATSEGLLKLFDSAGGNIKIVMTAISSFVTSMTDADNIATTAAATTTHRGQITLSSADDNTIKLTDGSATNAGLTKLGLNG